MEGKHHCSITELQQWLVTAHGSSKFHITNTNSIVRGGNLSIKFYVNPGSFQINKDP
jgi:hypothetical protein